MAKLVIFISLLLIIFSLASALFYFMREPFGSKKMVRALTIRVSLSLVLFAFLLVGFYMGWLHPHSAW